MIPFRFTRVFGRAVGVSPHRYVVHLRLQRAVELMRDGRYSVTVCVSSPGCRAVVRAVNSNSANARPPPLVDTVIPVTRIAIGGR